MTSCDTEADRWTPRALLAIIVAFSSLALAYSATIPLFNAPDEPYHFEYLRYLAERGRLPNQAIEEQATSNEGFNPPLYYAIGALALSLIAPDHASDLVVPSSHDLVQFRSNPERRLPTPPRPPLNPSYLKWGLGRDRNMFLRVDQDRFPFQGSPRVLHLLRMLSVLFGAATLVFVFKTGEALAPGERRVALLATAACAFNPQFAFVHAYLNNDALATTLSTISLYLITRYALAERGSAGRLVASGISVGLGLLTKVNTAFLVPTALLAIALRAGLRGEGARRILRDALVFLLPVLLISGWFFLRNVAVYGLDDPLGWRLRALQNPALVMPPELRGLFFRNVFFQRLFTTWWGHFDWLTIPLPAWQYGIYAFVSLMAPVGVVSIVREVRRGAGLRGRSACFALHLVAIALVLGSLIALNFTFLSAQGRLLFPVISPLCFLIAKGLCSAIGPLERAHPPGAGLVAGSLPLLLCGLDLYALLGVVAPAYP